MKSCLIQSVYHW